MSALVHIISDVTLGHQVSQHQMFSVRAMMPTRFVLCIVGSYILIIKRLWIHNKLSIPYD